jgi:hypothetical protein
MTSNQEPGGTDEASEPQIDNPRGFSQATGFLLQAVGATFFLGSCVWATATDLFQDRPPIATPQSDGLIVGSDFTTWFGRFDFPAKLDMAQVVCTVLGGMAMFAVGMGLQADRKSAANFAVAVTAVLCIFWIVDVLLRLWLLPSVIGILVAIAFSVASALLFLMAGHSRQVLLAHPPPADQNMAPPDFDPKAPH